MCRSVGSIGSVGKITHLGSVCSWSIRHCSRGALWHLGGWASQIPHIFIEFKHFFFFFLFLTKAFNVYFLKKKKKILAGEQSDHFTFWL